MSRVQTLATGVFVAALVAAGLTGTPVFIMVLAPVFLVGLASARIGSGRGVADTRWSTGTKETVPVVSPVRGRRAGSFETIRALGRTEGRLLFWSPWFAMGLGFCAVIVLMFAVLFADDNNQAWAEWAQTAPWFVHPLVGMTVLASHRAMTRAHRDDTEEVLGVCPTSPETRTLGHLAAAWVPVLAASVFLVVFAVLLAWRSPGMHGPLTDDNAGDLVGAVLLAVGGVALGVALGRWIRFGLTPVAAVLSIAAATTVINGVGGKGWNPYVLLSTAPTIEAPSPVFTDRAVWAHVLWIGALIGIVTVGAALRHRRDRPIAVLGLGLAVTAVIAGLGATAEMPASSAERIAALVSRPEAHQECTDIAGRASVCMFPLHRALLERIATDTAPVAAALPPQVGPLVIRQLYDNSIDQLPPEVRRHLPERLPERPEEEAAFADFDTLGTYTGARRDLAQTAVGLPTTTDDDLMPTVVAGQARGVVALWLSVRGLDPEDQRRRTTIPNPAASDPFERGSLDGVGVCSVPSVVWSAQDLSAARALIGLGEDIVADVIQARWHRWIDPTTGTDEFLAAVGLPSEGPYDEVEPRPGEPC